MAYSYSQWLGNRPNNTKNYGDYQAFLRNEKRMKEGEKSPLSTKLHLGGIGPTKPSSQYYESTGSTGSYGGNSTDLNGMTDYWASQYESDGSDYYKTALEKSKAARQAKIDAAVGRLNSQRSGIYKTADKSAAENYAYKEKQRVELPQILSATGKSGGLTDSAVLDMNTSYENRKNDILTDRDAAVNDVDLAIADAQATGESEVADLEAQYAMMEAQQAAQRQSKLDEYNQNLAMQYYKNLSSGSGSKSSSKPRLTVKQAEDAYKNGNKAKSVIDALTYYYGDDYSPAEQSNGADIFTQAYQDMQSSGDPRSWLMRNAETLKQAGIYDQMVRSIYAIPAIRGR